MFKLKKSLGQNFLTDKNIINTVEEVWNAGLAGIAIEYNEILIINFDEVVSYANKKGLFIAGI